MQPDGSAQEIGPERCSRGHELKAPNVQIRGAAQSIQYVCRICGYSITEHRDGTITYGQEKPF